MLPSSLEFLHVHIVGAYTFGKVKNYTNPWHNIHLCKRQIVTSLDCTWPKLEMPNLGIINSIYKHLYFQDQTNGKGNFLTKKTEFVNQLTCQFKQK